MADYEMFSTAGNRACTKLVKSVVDNINEGHFKTRDEAVDYINMGLSRIAENHGEVYDTEPHGHIGRNSAKAFEAKGWKPYHRFTDGD